MEGCLLAPQPPVKKPNSDCTHELPCFIPKVNSDRGWPVYDNLDMIILLNLNIFKVILNQTWKNFIREIQKIKTTELQLKK